MTLTLMRVSVVTILIVSLLSIGILLGNQRPAQAESLAQQIVCKVFSELNRVSQGIPVPFPAFRPGCGNRGGI